MFVLIKEKRETTTKKPYCTVRQPRHKKHHNTGIHQQCSDTIGRGQAHRVVPILKMTKDCTDTAISKYYRSTAGAGDDENGGRKYMMMKDDDERR